MTIYYVYAYLRKDGSPYYIGKGKNKRAYSKDHAVSLPPDKSRIIFLETNLTNIGACAIERRMISWYGRKDLNTGILHNRTNGGEGAPGNVQSVEHRKKKSDAAKHRWETIGMPDSVRQKIREKNIGKVMSNETRSKISASNKGKKRSPAAVEKLRQLHIGSKRSDDTKQKLKECRKNYPRLQCPHCNKITVTANFNRWHGSNCKLYPSDVL